MRKGTYVLLAEDLGTYWGVVRMLEPSSCAAGPGCEQEMVDLETLRQIEDQQGLMRCNQCGSTVASGKKLNPRRTLFAGSTVQVTFR